MAVQDRHWRGLLDGLLRAEEGRISRGEPPGKAVMAVFARTGLAPAAAWPGIPYGTPVRRPDYGCGPPHFRHGMMLVGESVLDFTLGRPTDINAGPWEVDPDADMPK